MKKEYIVIVGAGSAGRQLLKQLRKLPQNPYRIVGFIDDKEKAYKKINDISILGDSHDLPKIIRRFNVNQVIISIPSARGETIRKIVAACEGEKIQFKIVPRQLEVIYRGGVKLDKIKPVQIEDMLGSSIVKNEQLQFRNAFFEKKILVTGAAGSIGSELCRQLIQYDPMELTAVDWWENGMFSLDMDIGRIGNKKKFQGVIGNIQDYKRIRAILHQHKPEIIFHAAAYKHVPLMQRYPTEAVKNNVIGTENLVKAAFEESVKKFVFISTDKAADPANIMGATKLIGEQIVEHYNRKGKTKYVSVRFGNVANSYGSVIPVFRKQLNEGGPLTVTDSQMERYFMNISEAVQLVMRASILAKGGELFILDMGEPVKIYELAKLMIILEGFIPGNEIPITFIGKRPGEKISETLTANGELLEKTKNGKIYKVMKHYNKYISVQNVLKGLKKAIKQYNDDEVIDIIRQVAPEIR